MVFEIRSCTLGRFCLFPSSFCFVLLVHVLGWRGRPIAILEEETHLCEGRVEDQSSL